MRAVRRTARGFEVLERPEPEQIDGAVVVDVRSAGICGSDLTFAKGGPLPFTLGHEVAGVLDDGTPVAVEPLAPCWSCDQCAGGNYHRCTTVGVAKFLGMGGDGGMADRMLVPSPMLVPLPAGLPVTDGCLVEPLAVVIHGMRLAGLEGGQRVAVVGGGTIGLLAVAVARSIGCDVGLVARHPAQVAAGEALGAAGPPTGEYDVVVDAAGSEPGLATAARLARPGAVVLLLAVYSATVPLPGIAALSKELRTLSTITYNRHAGGRDVDAAAAMLAVTPSIPAALITHRFPLDDAPHAFRVAQDRAGGAIKVVVEP